MEPIIFYSFYYYIYVFILNTIIQWWLESFLNWRYYVYIDWNNFLFHLVLVGVSHMLAGWWYGDARAYLYSCAHRTLIGRTLSQRSKSNNFCHTLVAHGGINLRSTGKHEFRWYYHWRKLFTIVLFILIWRGWRINIV